MIDDFTEKDAIWSSRTARIIDRTGYTMFLMQIEKGFKLLDKNNDGKIYFDTYRNFLIKDHSCDTLLLPSFE
uniref:EF-hand domain-containing protein n=1 Tax=Parastrongyloides trichosuri TaxID=131310 RepID=A0A0N4Z4B3_PARTI